MIGKRSQVYCLSCRAELEHIALLLRQVVTGVGQLQQGFVSIYVSEICPQDIKLYYENNSHYVFVLDLCLSFYNYLIL